MPITIEIKNKTNWAITIILGVGLLILSFIMLIMIPLISIQAEGFYIIVNYISTVIPFAAFLYYSFISGYGILLEKRFSLLNPNK